MSKAKDILVDQLRWLNIKQEEAKVDLISANRQLVRAQTDVTDLEREMDERNEAMKDIQIGIDTLEKYGA